MKKSFETAEITITIFDNSEVILASSEAPFVPVITKGDNETEIL